MAAAARDGRRGRGHPPTYRRSDPLPQFKTAVEPMQPPFHVVVGGPSPTEGGPPVDRWTRH
jgi:hypothetical protein